MAHGAAQEMLIALWGYGEGSSKRDQALGKILTDAKKETGMNPSNRTICRWLNHFLKY
jgi:hypothetical protein